MAHVNPFLISYFDKVIQRIASNFMPRDKGNMSKVQGLVTLQTNLCGLWTFNSILKT